MAFISSGHAVENLSLHKSGKNYHKLEEKKFPSYAFDRRHDLKPFVKDKYAIQYGGRVFHSIQCYSRV